jgi:uncharacterized protein (TIGR02147 family)
VEIETSKQDLIPKVQNFLSYRKYISEWFEYKKRQRTGFSHRGVSKKLGLTSPNFILLVIKGERNISMELAAKLSELMGHNELEQEYFLSLIRLEQASQSSEKLDAQKILLRLARKISTSVMQTSQMEVISSWQYMLVRECVFFPDFKPEPVYISEKLDGLVSLEEAEGAIATLIKGGFWKQDGHGSWLPQEPVLDTGNGIFKEALINQLHSQTLNKWATWMDDLEPSQRELGLLYIPMNKEKIPELKERIRQFQDEIIGWLQDEKNPDQMVQLGTYLIPLKKKN